MKALTKVAGAAVFAAAACTTSFAADKAKAVSAETDSITTGAVKTKKKSVPIYRYNSEVQGDGKVVVKLDENSVTPGELSTDVLTVFAPSVRATETLLHSQDWYMTVDPNGGMRGIYTVPRDRPLPSSVLRSLGDGYGILKVNPRNSFFKVFPSKYQLASQLTTFSEAARKAVCNQSNKPEMLNASVDVKPGWSASGRITFNATWKVSELCKKPAS